MPLVRKTGHYVAGLGTTATILIMLKQSVNGVVNAMIASLLVTYVPVRRWLRGFPDRRERSLDKLVFSVPALFIIIPMLIPMSLSGRAELRRMNERMQDDLENGFRQVHATVATWYEQQFNAVKALAELAGEFGLENHQQLQAITQNIQQAYPDFHNLYIANAAGVTVAFSPPENAEGQTTIGLDFSDREYFKSVKDTLQPFASGIFMGRGGVTTPIVTFSAPVIMEGTFQGIAVGAVRVDRLSQLLMLHPPNEISRVTLADASGQVIASTHSGISPLDGLQRIGRREGDWPQGPGETVVTSSGSLPAILHWKDSIGSLPAILHWKDSISVMNRPLGESIPWSLVMEYPLAGAQQYLYRRYIGSLSIMALVILAALILGYLAQRYFARPLSLLASITTNLPDQVSQDQAIRWPKVFGDEMRMLVTNFDAMIASLRSSFREISAARERIEHDALHDSLTGLPNRRYLQQVVFDAAGRPKRSGLQGILFVDLDRFSVVNDSLGYDAGDELLREVAHRLVSTVRRGDVVVRQGGDEFVLLLSGRSMDEFVVAAERVLDVLSPPFALESGQFYLSASIGISVYPEHGETLTELVRRADSAMYEAKRSGGSGYKIYDNGIRESTVDRLKLESDLRAAWEQGRLELHYQPQVDLKSNRIVGVEALLRWKRSGAGFISPAEFIPILEESGLIVQVTEWALRTACLQAAKWQRKFSFPLKVAVNLSPRQLNQERLPDIVRRVLDESGLEGRCLELEITEQNLIRNTTAVGALLHELAEMGVTIALDDFGTGFSSLQYLKQLPIDVIKIDKMFVCGIDSDSNDKAIVTATVGMARNLGMKTIAEGVEEEAHAKYLESIGCDMAQGYYFCKPAAPEKIELESAFFQHSSPLYHEEAGNGRRRHQAESNHSQNRA